MAQLDKARRYGRWDSGFESLQVRQNFLKILLATELSHLKFRGDWLLKLNNFFLNKIQIQTLIKHEQ